MFRIAAILQGIAKRVEAGTASSEQARANGARARPMAELAWRFAQKHSCSRFIHLGWSPILS
jgi:hypothetical protein